MSVKHLPTVQELFDLTGRTALITGARSPLGFAMASALAEAGARVVTASRDPKAGRAVAAKLGGREQGNHLSATIDQMNEGSIRRGFAAAVKRAGHIDVLVNNGHEVLAADWRSVTGREFTHQLANQTGYFLLARLVYDHAVKRKSQASIVMLGSMYGLVASYPGVYEGISAANPAAYQALKAGIIQLTRHLAVYWAREGVRVNCLSPGPFPSNKAPTKLIKRLKSKSPMNRMGAPHELKGAIVFLASNASSYVTGQNLVVDGGWTAW